MNDDRQKCDCGGTFFAGYMYGDRFIAGTVDMKFAFRGKEYLLNELFPDGIPKKGDPAIMCSNCFRIVIDKRRPI